MKKNLPLIIDSSNATLPSLLAQINVVPDQAFAVKVDETFLDTTLPHVFSQKLSQQRAERLCLLQEGSGIFLSSARVISVGRRILPIAFDDEDVKFCLDKVSGRRSKIFTSVCIIKKEDQKQIKKIKMVQSVIKMKRLSEEDIKTYVQSLQGLGMLGGLNLEGLASSLIVFASGSYTGIKGLPLYETKNMLLSLGFQIDFKIDV